MQDKLIKVWTAIFGFSLLFLALLPSHSFDFNGGTLMVLLYLSHRVFLCLIILLLIKKYFLEEYIQRITSYIKKSLSKDLLINPDLYQLSSGQRFKNYTVGFIMIMLSLSSLLEWQHLRVRLSNYVAYTTKKSLACNFITYGKDTTTINKYYDFTLNSWERSYTNCIKYSDYELYLQKLNDCSIYFNISEQYANCKLNKFKSNVATAEILTCSDIPYIQLSKKYTGVTSEAKSCEYLQTTQRAILEQRPEYCSTISYPLIASMCISNFQGTDEWQKMCKTISDKVSGTNGLSFSTSLIKARCLSVEDANTSFSGPLIEYNFYAKRIYSQISKGMIQYSAPAWFDGLWFNGSEIFSEVDFKYLKSIGTNPNAVDSLGRTALIVVLHNQIHFFDRQNSDYDDAANYIREGEEKDTERRISSWLQQLIDFGVDPYKKDLLNANAIDYAKMINNTQLQKKVLQVLQQNENNN